jgi:hypothetical protein
LWLIRRNRSQQQTNNNTLLSTPTPPSKRCTRRRVADFAKVIRLMTMRESFHRPVNREVEAALRALPKAFPARTVQPELAHPLERIRTGYRGFSIAWIVCPSKYSLLSGLRRSLGSCTARFRSDTSCRDTSCFRWLLNSCKLSAQLGDHRAKRRLILHRSFPLFSLVSVQILKHNDLFSCTYCRFPLRRASLGCLPILTGGIGIGPTNCEGLGMRPHLGTFTLRGASLLGGPARVLGPVRGDGPHPGRGQEL